MPPPLSGAPPDARPDPLLGPELSHLRARIARWERTGARAWGAAPFGDARVDGRLAGGGLARGAWHEIGGAGLERECPAAAAGFAAAVARQCAGDGAIIWALRRDDAHAPGLAGLGLDPDRVIFLRAASDDDVLAIMEDALRTRGVGAAIGEAGAVSLTAGKRLHLACEHGGASAFVLRRALYTAPRAQAASAATTRWVVASAPSDAREPYLGPPRWRVTLERSRGGRPGAWIMEAEDEASKTPSNFGGRALRVVAELADHAAEAAMGTDVRADRARPGDHGADRRRAALGGGR